MNLHPSAGSWSLVSFVGGTVLPYLQLFVQRLVDGAEAEKLSSLSSSLSSCFGAYFLFPLALVSCGRKRMREEEKGVALRAGALGVAFGAGTRLAASGLLSGSPSTVGLYVSALSFFHFSEFQSTAWWNTRFLSFDSFLLNHSTEYHAAMVASWLEFAVERHLLGCDKDFGRVAQAGLALIVVGEALRKLAMHTAKTNFNHLIQWRKAEDHVLVTSGVYAWSRHPSYVGWFLWSIGTQLLLQNPLCLVAYAAASWRFFRERIEEEERTLLAFFGEEYLRYQRRVGVGIPGIRGFSIQVADDDDAGREKTTTAPSKSAGTEPVVETTEDPSESRKTD